MTRPAETIKLNDAQCAALDLGRDLLISAGAGAGKTQVLGLRYLAALETGRARVPEILAFTFTEKAAAEMRERVLKLLLARISELRNGESTQELQRLQRARAEFAQNRISTVHGFCHRLLAAYAWEAGLEPGAPVLEPRDQQNAREAAIRRVLLQTAANDPLASSLERLSASVRLYVLSATLHGAIANRQSLGMSLKSGADAWANPEAEIARRRALWNAWEAQQLKPILAAIKAMDFAAVQTAGGRDALALAMMNLRDATRAPTLRSLAEHLLTKSGQPRKFGRAGAKANWPRDTLEEARAAMTAAAAAIAEPMARLGRYNFDEAHERRCGQVATDLGAVFDAACAAYTEECGGALDFLELELRAIALLRDNADVLAEVTAHTLLIMVDEYQDTNPTQSELFRLLIRADSTPGRFFAVGDSKQAIYGFRGSDVAIFNRAQEAMARRNQAVTSMPQRLPWGLSTPDVPQHRSGLIGMDSNYRSAPDLITAGNAVFAQVLAREEMRDFDARPQDMVPGRKSSEFPACAFPVELHLMPARAGNHREGFEEPLRRATEADFVAARVSDLIAQGENVSDIAILMRRGTRNDEYRAAFAAAGIPLLLVGDSGLLNTQEAADCINLLRLCANEADDLAALGVLRSPFGGLSDRQLTMLALGPTKGTLLERLRGWDGLAGCKPASRFLRVLGELREMAGREHPSLLLAHAVGAMGYALAVGCGSEAEQRLGNLGRILQVTRELQRQYPTLASLAREMTERAHQRDDEPQATPEKGAQGVRLMTVHRSKGLEFPIVIVPDLAARPGGQGVGMIRELPSDPSQPLGVWLKALADETRGEFTPDFAAWQSGLDAEERAQAEERRILYVAWTRAARRLLLVGTVPAEFKGNSWAAQLLAAIGAEEFGTRPTRIPAGMSIHWQQAPEHAPPRLRKTQLQALRQALKHGEIKLPEPVDASLIQPLPQPQAAMFLSEPEAAEFGTLVHNALEYRLRGGSADTAEAGIADARVSQNVAGALEALATLPPAREVKPEFSFETANGARRVDLLRVLDGDVVEIIDFKTEEPPAAGLEQAIRQRHGEQLRGYAAALQEYMQARGRKVSAVRTLVCLTAPSLPANQRLVEISP